AGGAQKILCSVHQPGMNIQMITTSEIKISVLVSRERAQEALRIVHRAFELDRVPQSRPHATLEVPGTTNGPSTENGSRSKSAAADVDRLQSMNMEDLTIYDV